MLPTCYNKQCDDIQIFNDIKEFLKEDDEYLYFFDNEWVPGMPGTALCPLDPELGIKWPISIDSGDLNQIK